MYRARYLFRFFFFFFQEGRERAVDRQDRERVRAHEMGERT